MKPKISIIVPGLLGYDSVLAALDAWEAQTCRSQMQVIVLCPTAPKRALPPGQVVLETGSMLLHQARAAGIRLAEADYIMLAEDHCLPDPECVDAILHRIDERWDAVGPALRCGNPGGAVTQGSFLMGYAQWMLPAGGLGAHLPGHNAVMRRQLLIDMGDELEDELIAALFLMRRLHRNGHKFYVEAGARMRHFDVPGLRKSMAIFFAVGEGCGAVRLKGASRLRRLLYGVLTPATAARHFARGFLHYVRAGRRAGLSPTSLVTGGLFACVWACGEAVGAWKGIEPVLSRLWISEIKPVSREQAASTL